KDETTKTGVQRAPLPSPRLRRGDWPALSLAGNSAAGRPLFFAHERVGLSRYLFASTGAAAFCSGLCGLAVTSLCETAVPRWFILAYGVSCVLLSLLAPVLCRSRQQHQGAVQPVYAMPTDARAKALWTWHERDKGERAGEGALSTTPSW